MDYLVFFYDNFSFSVIKIGALNGPNYWNLASIEKSGTTCHLSQAFSRDFHLQTPVY